MATRHGGADRVSTKAKLANELLILGKVITETRERAGLRQQDVASRLGLPASYLSKVENGTRRLDVIELVQLADALGASAADIVTELEARLRGPLPGDPATR